MRLQGFILKTEWKDAAEQLRRFVQDATGGLAGHLTIADNMEGELSPVVRWNSTSGAIQVATSRRSKPTAVVALTAAVVSDPGSVVSWSPVKWKWSPSSQTGSNMVEVSDIGFLARATDYDVTFWIAGGA